MKDFIQRLPIDIILYIIPYTYNLQNKNLLNDIINYKKTRTLNDIINYKKTRTLLLELYYEYWIINHQQIEEPEIDKYWLLKDIYRYANNYNDTMYVNNFYNIFKRNISLQTIEAVDKYKYNLQMKNLQTQINIFLGLLTISERNDFIACYMK
jgi:hypothetical protein